MTYREAGYIGAEPSFAECLSLVSNNNSVIEGSVESYRKTSPSHSVISERGTSESNYKREDYMADSVRSSLSGQSDNCNSPPMNQNISVTDGTMQICRPNAYSFRESQVASLGHNFNHGHANIYSKSYALPNDHKPDFFHGHNAMNNAMKYSPYKQESLYDSSLCYPDSFANANAYETRGPVVHSNRNEAVNSSMYSHPGAYQNNDVMYGNPQPHGQDPAAAGFINRSPINDYMSHQVVNSSGLFHSNPIMQCPPKDIREGITPDYSWMQKNKPGKKTHESRRKFNFFFVIDKN